jgi:drug/metabolite transporter (DMT)-like permease
MRTGRLGRLEEIGGRVVSPAPPRALGPVFALLVVQLLFGAMPVAGKVAIGSFGPPSVAFFRMATGAALFQVLRVGLRQAPIPWSDQPKLLLCGILGISANQLLFLHGLSLTSATHAAVLTTTIPVLTLVASAVLGRERLIPRKILGILLALGGVLYLLAGRDPTGHASLLGDLFVFANATVYAFYLVLSRDLLARHSPLSVLAWIFTWGLLTALPFTGLPVLEGHPSAAWAAVAFIVIGPTIGSYWLNLYALQTVPASVVAVFIYLQPSIAAVLAVPLLGEQPTVRLLVSAVLSFIGVFVATRPASPSVTAPESG